MKLKRIVLKEEFVVLTGDAISAVLLDLILHWSHNMKRFDEYVEEERARDPDINMPLTDGWINKSAKQFEDELMGMASGATIRRKLINLTKQGWIDKRHNPNNVWDRTMQYKPNIRAIQRDLAELGYTLTECFRGDFEVVIMENC